MRSIAINLPVDSVQARKFNPQVQGRIGSDAEDRGGIPDLALSGPIDPRSSHEDSLCAPAEHGRRHHPDRIVVAIIVRHAKHGLRSTSATSRGSRS